MAAGLIVLAAWVLGASVLACATACVLRWRVGRAAEVDWRSGLKAFPRRYLVDVHHVVARNPEAARMHALVAGGLLGGTVLLLLGAFPFLRSSRLYWGLVALCFAAGLAGAVLVARRRLPRPPRHLSGGSFRWLPLWLGLYMGGGFLVALPCCLAGPGRPAGPVRGAIGGTGLVLAVAGGAGLVGMVRRGPLRHAIAGTVHLVAHPRPERFGGGRSTALRPADLEAPQLGCATASDFTWNELASFDACIQCGRCEQACPAFAAGQRLNPKKLIQDLAASMPGGAATQYSGSPAPHAPPTRGAGGDPGRPIVGEEGLIHPDTLWACTTCRACVEECPMMIEHVDAVIGLRRNEILMRGSGPAAISRPLRALRYAAEVGARPLGARTDFASGLSLPALGPGEETDILLWLGEGAFDLRYGRSLRALVRLMQHAGLRFAVLDREPDTGDLARRLGDEATFQRAALEVTAALSGRRFARLVTADPHAFHVLRNEYPALGGNWTVIHHTQLLDELVATGALRLEKRDIGRVAYHDPCYLGRYNGEFEAPRRLLDAACSRRVEMERHGHRAMCCGGGGGGPVSDVDAEWRIPDLRMAQAAEAGATVVAVACPGCTAMLEGVRGAPARVLDVAELVLDAVLADGKAAAA